LLNKKSFKSPLQLIATYRKIKFIITDILPDKIITYTIIPNLLVGFISNQSNFNFYPNITGLGYAFNNSLFIKKIAIYLYKITLKNAKFVFFENNSNFSTFLQNKIIKINQGVVLNGAGVDLNHFMFSDYPIRTERVRIIYIGRIMKDKGIKQLVYLINKIDRTKVSFTIIGSTYKSYRSTIKGLIKGKKIEYFDFIDDIRPYIAKAHVLVLPSYHEGMANVLLEAAAMGRPIIASDIPGCQEAILSGYNGYLFKKKDSQDFYNKVTTFLNLSYVEKIVMGANSRKYITSKFSKDFVVNETIKYLFFNL
jgi:galacturonosyltransferase